MKERSTMDIGAVAGLDLGDRASQLCVLDVESGAVIEETRLATTASVLRHRFAGVGRLRIALEVGTHSPWVSRLLEDLGHEVWVANPRKLRLIYENRQKDDRVDAEYLARLARVDPRLLAPVTHRGAAAQADLARVRSRAVLVASRTRLITHCRGAVKSWGGRLPSCDARTFAAKASAALPAALGPALEPVLEAIDRLTQTIRQMDRALEQLATREYPETALLTQVRGVGSLTALTFVLTLGQAQRFRRSRTVGAYLGLVPARAESGASRPALRISKEGDRYLRTLLVQCAHYILGPFGEDCELRRYGERLIERGGKGAKPRAAVAVARKLAVQLHHLWISGDTYDPFPSRKTPRRAA